MYLYSSIADCGGENEDQLLSSNFFSYMKVGEIEKAQHFNSNDALFSCGKACSLFHPRWQ